MQDLFLVEQAAYPNSFSSSVQLLVLDKNLAFYFYLESFLNILLNLTKINIFGGLTKMTQILIPRKELLEAKEFYANRTDRALRNLQEENYQAVFMPQIVDARLEASREDRIFQTWYTTPSIKATGRTKQGNAVVVYAHIPNYFSNPDNIEKAINQGLVNYAGILPQKEFQKLLDLEDKKNVFVVDYNVLKNSSSCVIPVSKALKHPQTIPFLGGEERAEKYLQKHKEVYGNRMGIWHSDDLADDESFGRLLFLGNNYYYDLSGNSNFVNVGRFVGVQNAVGARKKIQHPTKKQLEKVISDYVAPVNRLELKERIAGLYHK